MAGGPPGGGSPANFFSRPSAWPTRAAPRKTERAPQVSQGVVSRIGV
jgi:hypothetical protein